MSTCESASAAAMPFMQTCVAKGAGLYVGWTNLVSDAASSLAAKFVIDRLLGANMFAPKEDPPQRPFDYQSVWADLHKRGLYRHPTPPGTTPAGTTDLVYYPPSGAQFGLLAPSIADVLIDEEHERAILRGMFGEPAEGERSVWVGGVQLNGAEWSKDKITVSLPLNGDGSSGDVFVQVRGHKSNVRRITEWNVPLHYHWTDVVRVPGWQFEGSGAFQFRADIGTTRDQAGTPPRPLIRSATPTFDLIMSVIGSGSRALGGDCAAVLSGNGQFPVQSRTHPAPAVIASGLELDVDAHNGLFFLAYGSEPQDSPFLQSYVGADCPPISPSPVSCGFGFLDRWSDCPSPLDDGTILHHLPALDVTFDAQFRLVALSHKSTDLGGEITVEWPDVVPSTPPAPDAAR